MAGPLIDCDVHEEMIEPDVDLLPYLPKAWREFMQLSSHLPAAKMSVLPPNALFDRNPEGFARTETIPPGGGSPGSSVSLMLEQLIEPNNIVAAILSGSTAMNLSGLSNPYFAIEVARAVNDYRADHWLAADDRLKGSISLGLQVPEWAAAEVRRKANDSRFVQTCVAPNPLQYPFGHPIYDSVHRACAETLRPFGIHAFGDNGSTALSPQGGGWPTLYAEAHSSAPQSMMSHVASFIFHGVFERYRDLKVVLQEPSVGWIPGFLRRLDETFKGVRREVPWCKRLPSDYFVDHVRVTTQPFDALVADDVFVTALADAGAENFLMFSSDYPHWDADVPRAVLSMLPPAWRDKVAYGNAAELYGIDNSVAA